MIAENRAAWDKAIKDFQAHLKINKRSTRTADQRRDILMRFTRHFDGGPGNVTTGDIQHYIVSQEWAPRTQQTHLAGMKMFYRWATPSISAVDPTVGIPVIKVPRKVKADPVSRSALIKAMNEAPPRVTRMIELAVYLGLKAVEIANFKPSEIRRDDTGKWVLPTRWEGGFTRDVPVPPTLLAQYQALKPGWAFPGRDEGHISAAYVTRLVNRRLPSGLTTEKIRNVFNVNSPGYNIAASVHLLDYPELVDPMALQQTLFSIERDLTNNPATSISESRRLLEAILKGVLIDADQDPGEVKLPKLYHLASTLLDIDVVSNKKASEAMRDAMGAMVTTVQSIAELRNKTGAHGAVTISTAEPRHARLAFNAAIAVSEFVAETWRASKLS